MGILDIAFPHRRDRRFGVASFALVFVTLIAEIELLAFIGIGLVARRFDLFVELQEAILPAAVLVSLVASSVFAWRARSWSRARMKTIREWGKTSSSYAEQIAHRHKA